MRVNISVITLTIKDYYPDLWIQSQYIRKAAIKKFIIKFCTQTTMHILYNRLADSNVMECFVYITSRVDG